MGPRQIQVDNLDRAPSAAASHDVNSWAYRPAPRVDWRGIGVLCMFGVVMLLILYWLFGRDMRFWIADRPWLIYAVLLIVSLFLIKRWLLVEQPGGYKVMWLRADERVVIGGMLDVQRTEARRMFPHAAQLTLTNTPLLPAANSIDAEVIDDAPQAVITPDSVWLPWLTELPHTMIAGGTGTGKTTLARVELYERLDQGFAGIVLDPKGKEWYGLPVIGGGRKFELILAMLDQLHREMADRFTAYADGERTFQPIKAIVDEVPDIMDACLDMRRRLVDGRWSRFSPPARQPGARDRHISVTLMTQSPLVEDIGMNSAMRKNFNRIALGDEVLRLLREETDAKRRALLQDALRGQQYPAAMLRRGAVYLLDTSNIVRLSQRHIAAPLGWQPTCSAPPPLATGAIIYPPGIVSTNAKIAWLLRSNYSYRQIERELSVSHATIAAVSKWLQTKAHTNGAT